MIMSAESKIYYNNELKREFLNKLGYHSQLVYERIFHTSKQYEEKFNLDLYNFDLDQIKLVMTGRNPATLMSSINNGSIISSYMKWAINLNYRKEKNPLEGIESTWYEQFVHYETIFSKQTIDKLIFKSVNAQDAVIIILAFEGVGGEGSEEILNLTKQDINFSNNELTLRDIFGNVRILNVSKECIDICMAALREIEYEKRNGMASLDSKSLLIPLVDNDFVIKTAKTRNKNEGKADKHTLYRRIKTLGEIYDKPNLTITNIRNSGMLFMGKKILDEVGKLDKKQYESIFQNYNLNKVMRNGELSYNYYPYKKSFLNVKTINEVYSKNANH